MCTYVVGFMCMNQNPGVGSTCACPQSTHFFFSLTNTCFKYVQTIGKKVENHGNPGLCLLWPLLCVRGIQWLLAQKGSRHVPDIWTEGNAKNVFWCFLGFHAFYVLLTSRSTTTFANSTARRGKQSMTKYTYLLWIPQIPNIYI